MVASSVGAILSHQSARVDPLQLGSHGARPAFSLRQLVRQGVPPGSLRIGVLAPRSRAPARPGLPRHQRAGENHIVEQARLKIGKLADVWLILVTLPGSMLAFPCSAL